MKRSITDAIEQVMYAVWNLNEAWNAERNIEGITPESNPFGQDLGVLLERLEDFQNEVDKAIGLPLVVLDKSRKKFWSESGEYHLGALNGPDGDERWALYKSTMFRLDVVAYTYKDFESDEERTAWAIEAIRKYEMNK